jgi:putative transposase
MVSAVGRFTGFRFTLEPSPVQAGALWRHAGASRFAFNQCLRLVKDALDARASGDEPVQVPWSGFDLINSFNGWKRSAEAGRVLVADPDGAVEVVATGLAWRGEVCAQVFEEAAQDLGRGLAAFAAARRGGGRRVGFPRFKRRGQTVPSFRIRQMTDRGVSRIRVGENHPRSVRLPKIGVVRVREDTRRLRRLLRTGRGRVLSATVSVRTGRWVIGLTVEAADLHPAVRHPSHSHSGSRSHGEGPDDGALDDGDRRGGWVGVDRGLRAFVVAATADGGPVLREQNPPRPLRRAGGRLRRLQRAVSRKQRGSRHRRAAVGRLSRAHARVRDIRAQYLHRVANTLVKTHDRLVLEDLHIGGMLRNRRLAAAISDAGWAEFDRIVCYKQQWRGGQVVHASRWYPSTRTCSRCHTLGPALPLSQRIFSCQRCGHQADRDHNAAVNLAVWGEQHHTQTRDPEVRGPETNASRGAGSGPHPGVSETGPHDGGTPPPTPSGHGSRDAREGRCHTSRSTRL